MVWILGGVVLVLFTGLHLALARRWRPVLPERVMAVFWRWPWSPKEPTSIMSRRLFLLLGPLGAASTSLLGALIAGTTQALWVNGLTVLFQLEVLREMVWSLRHTAQHTHNQPNPSTPAEPENPR